MHVKLKNKNKIVIIAGVCSCSKSKRDAPLGIHYGNQMILQLNKRISSL